MLGSSAQLADTGRLAGIRDDLPLYIFSGDADPLAGGGALIEMVADRYRVAGLTDVTVKLYPGARHETLNETNRDEVTQDLITWLGRRGQLTSDASAHTAATKPTAAITTLRVIGARSSAPSSRGRSGGWTMAATLPTSNAPPRASTSQARRSSPRNTATARYLAGSCRLWVSWGSGGRIRPCATASATRGVPRCSPGSPSCTR